MKDTDIQSCLTRSVSFACPFCGGQAVTGYNEEGNGASLHVLPACEKFVKLDPLDYIIAVRIELEGN